MLNRRGSAVFGLVKYVWFLQDNYLLPERTVPLLLDPLLLEEELLLLLLETEEEPVLLEEELLLR